MVEVKTKPVKGSSNGAMTLDQHLDKCHNLLDTWYMMARSGSTAIARKDWAALFAALTDLNRRL